MVRLKLDIELGNQFITDACRCKSQSIRYLNTYYLNTKKYLFGMIIFSIPTTWQYSYFIDNFVFIFVSHSCHVTFQKDLRSTQLKQTLIQMIHLEKTMILSLTTKTQNTWHCYNTKSQTYSVTVCWKGKNPVEITWFLFLECRTTPIGGN